MHSNLEQREESKQLQPQKINYKFNGTLFNLMLLAPGHFTNKLKNMFPKFFATVKLFFSCGLITAFISCSDNTKSSDIRSTESIDSSVKETITSHLRLQTATMSGQTR